MSDRHQLKPYTLRIPEDLRQDLEQSAAEWSRTLHAEVIERLRGSFVFVDQSNEMVRLNTSLVAAERESKLRERALVAQMDISELKSELLHALATRLEKLGAGDDMTRLALRASQAKSTRDVADAFARLWELRHGLEPGTLDRLIPIDGAGVAPEPAKRKSSASKK